MTFPAYAQTLQAVLEHPEEVIRQRRIEQILSIKLALPDEIRSRRRMRRTEYEKFETCLRDIETIKSTLTLAIKQERDLQGKLSFPNKETREVELTHRLEADPVYLQRDRMRRTMYSQVKYYDEEIGFLVDMDRSLLEIIALFTAMIEYETTNGTAYEKARKPSRSTRRAAARSAEYAHEVRPPGLAENLSLV